jgi:REP element-mobilizing transposase RayT
MLCVFFEEIDIIEIQNIVSVRTIKMEDKYKNKYRTKTARLANWDYGTNAIYFVTICTKNMECHFGGIENEEMQLNELGKLVEEEWNKSVDLRPDMNLYLDEFVVMPNHFHGIIVIGENKYNSGRDTMLGVSSLEVNDANKRDTKHSVFTSDIQQNSFGSQSKNLASIIRGFKSSVTTYAKKNGKTDFGWQSRFHEHIVRNEKSLQNIQTYILNNPSNWEKDKFITL